VIDPAKLYALSLAIGQSTDLETNCERFLSTLMKTTQVESSSVWLKYREVMDADISFGGKAEDTAVLAYAKPRQEVATEKIPLTHSIFSILARRNACSFAASEQEFAQVCIEQPPSEGVVTLFPLGDLGFLKLYTSSRERPYSHNDLRELSPLVEKFTTSLVACLDHRRLEREVVLRKRAEAGVRHREEYFRSLIENALDIILVLGYDASIKFASPSVHWVLGYEANDLEGHSLFELIHPNEVLSVRETFMARIQTPGVSPPSEVHVRHRDGRYRILTASTNNLLSAPSVGGVIMNCHDITEERELTLELERTRQVAIEANRIKGEFLANMSHEIRTPMNAVMGMASLLSETGLSAQQEDFVDTIRVSGEALLAVINDILDFSKIEAGKLQIEQAPFDLRECIEGALALMAPLASGKGIELAYWMEDTAIKTLVGDVTRTRQVLINLLGNAVKFTAEGGVLVIASVRSLDPGRWEVHVSVEDTGIGIEPDSLDRLFEPFSQADGTTTRKYGGTGLGLAICKRLSGLMGGRIWGESRPGQGSTFHFTLIGAGERAAAADLGLDELPLLMGKRLLVVSGNSVICRALTMQAMSWGMDPYLASSGSEALDRICLNEKFDVALLDRDLPDMERGELELALNGLKLSPPLPFATLTPLISAVQLRGQTPEGPRLSKPVRHRQLFEWLTRAAAGEPATAVTATDETAAAGGAGEMAALRILLAEDNPVNQKVALLTLKSLGITADLAENGVQVLDALARTPYDVILMDVQMPEMDGLEAARRIRANTPSGGPRIIAMTAHAMAGDRERCLAAGMDDYVSKPVAKEELRSLLAATRTARAGAQPTDAGSPLDAERLRQVRAEMGPDAVVALVTIFLDDAPARMRAIAEARRSLEWEALEREAHSLKGSAKVVGARALADQCQALELASRERRGDALDRLVEGVRQELDRAVPLLELERGQIPDPGANLSPGAGQEAHHG